jgi:hypothetical protein
MAIKLTYKTKAAGSWQTGEIMEWVFFVSFGVVFVVCV